MAREHFQLVSNEVKKTLDLEARIRSGEINPSNFDSLPKEEQSEVNGILFKFASEKIEPNQGTSALEFILFGFMRVMNKKVKGLALTEDEAYIESMLEEITNNHELTNTNLERKDWLFDYMEYAHVKSTEFLRNRKEHIERKIAITGKA